MKGSTALITGASSGIGEACAEQLAAQGVNLILVARRLDRLQKQQELLTTKFKVQVHVAAVDLQRPEQVTAMVGQLQSPLSQTDILINNAGLAKGTEKLMDGLTSDWDVMIDTNVKGLLYVTRALLPTLLRQPKAHIVNLGSVAGRWVYPGGGVYCATKFAVRALSEGLRMDLLGTRVRVTNIEPGMVETEFSQVRFADLERAKAVYKGMTPLSAADIAETIVWCLARPQHVNIQELVIFPTDQAAIQLVHRRDSAKPS